jgi:hypothetical protein
MYFPLLIGGGALCVGATILGVMGVREWQEIEGVPVSLYPSMIPDVAHKGYAPGLAIKYIF